MDRHTVVFVGVFALVGALIGLLVWAETTSPAFNLKKADWTCTRSEQHTTYQPVLINNQTHMLPVTTPVCVEYTKRRT